MACARLRNWLAAAFVFFCLAFILQAQVDTGTILGTVTDASGAVIPGAKVTIRNEGTSFTQSTTTSASGTYVFTPLRIGTYTVEVEKEGFKRQRRAGLGLNIQQQLVADVALSVGEVSSEVEVTAAAPVCRRKTGLWARLWTARRLTI